MAGAFANHASGLLVPAATLLKTQRTVLEADFAKLRRLMGLAKGYGMVPLFVCPTCKQAIKLSQHGQLVEMTGPAEQPKKAGGGRVTLACDCTDWTVR